ncbi:MAG: tyrosine-type recombinase/integrase, partial [Nitrosomonas sp.]|nr:tyrosine-type recombinase/integrase [Nitrosomonas sp.]
FRWHDLRHTWASWLTQKGVPLNVIQEMGAWESTEMVKRYAHLAPEQLRKHAMVVDEILNDTILTQVEN